MRWVCSFCMGLLLLYEFKTYASLVATHYPHCQWNAGFATMNAQLQGSHGDGFSRVELMAFIHKEEDAGIRHISSFNLQ